MKKIKFATLVIAVALVATGCREDSPMNEAGLTEKTYRPSRVKVAAMTFPGGTQTVFKAYGNYKDKKLPEPYKQPDAWVVYMAAPGWTDGGTPIVDRLATDAVAVSRVKKFIQDNQLGDKVKVAWLQYDENPNPLYVESLEKVPDNFIPLFLKPHGPHGVDFYIYSPAVRYGSSNKSMRYDQWLKPYLPFAKQAAGDYVGANEFQVSRGFNDPDGKYWDSWARHWFIVNPQGDVVDAYFSNLGNYFVEGADKPINSLIHHLNLDSESLIIPRIISTNYESIYTKPYWDKADAELRGQLGLSQ